ncbi:hypothetical protein FQN49_003726 [Arthroderma sp. PD_2]|nr:hypothetical protein FQN49_003726 [Arthroderma sp. PD_2]
MLQAMERPYYSHQEDTKLLRRTHPIASLATQPKREGSEDTSEGSLSQNRLGAECEGKANGANQRRRTQVACARCRKRKIKCSGDLGNGEACSNCKSSGTANCLFLRVNSAPLQTKASYPSWTYPYSTSTSSGTCGQQQAAYDAHALRANPLSIHAGSPGLPTYSVTQSGLGFGTTSEPVINSRVSYYGPSCHVGYEEDSMYNLPLSPYVLPSSNATGVSTVCGDTSATRGWRYPPALDPSNGGVYPDPGGSGSLSPGFPFLGRSTQKCTSSDTITLFPVMSSLSPGQDRTLPNPTTGRIDALASTVEGNSTTSPTAVCSSVTSTYKQAYQLTIDNDGAHCARPVTDTFSSPALPSSVKGSSSPVDYGFEYIPLSNVLQTCVPSTPFLVTGAVDTPVDTHQDSSERRAYKKATKGRNPTDTCVSEYGHSSNHNHRSGSARPSGGILVSGEVYERPQYTTPARNPYSGEQVTVPSHLSAGTSSCY